MTNPNDLPDLTNAVETRQWLVDRHIRAEKWRSNLDTRLGSELKYIWLSIYGLGITTLFILGCIFL